MINRKYLLFALAIFATGEVAAITSECPVGLPPIEEGTLEDIEFDREHSRTLQSTVVMLRKQHYEDIAIDDEFSELWLDEYLDYMDPSKSYLTQADIEQFSSSYGDQLDDYAAKGDLEAAEVIYELYRERAVSQLGMLLDTLDNPEWAFDYSSNDCFAWAVEVGGDDIWTTLSPPAVIFIITRPSVELAFDSMLYL